MSKQDIVTKQLFERRNLVVLMYSPNAAYTTIVAPDDPKVTEAKVVIDHKNGVWRGPAGGDNFSKTERVYKIGEVRHCSQGSRWGVISVYDRTDLEHLKKMVKVAREATQSETCGNY